MKRYTKLAIEYVESEFAALEPYLDLFGYELTDGVCPELGFRAIFMTDYDNKVFNHVNAVNGVLRLYLWDRSSGGYIKVNKDNQETHKDTGLVKNVFNQENLAGWWASVIGTGNVLTDKVNGYDATIIDQAFKGDGTAKASLGERKGFFVPGFEDFTFSFETIVDTVTATYAVVLSMYNSVTQGRIQFNNTALYIYDDDGNNLTWDITGLLTDGRHTFELTGLTGTITLKVDGNTIASGQSGSGLNLVSFGDALKDGSGNGLPSWCTLYNIKLTRKDSQQFIGVLGDKTSGFDQTRSDSVDANMTANTYDYIVGMGDVGLYDEAPYTPTFATALANYTDYIGTKFWNCRGNHDGTFVDSNDWKTFFGHSNTYFTKVIGDIEYFFFDSGLKEDETGYYTPQETYARTQASFENSTQGQWLTTALGNSTARWKILVMHIPTRTSATGYSAPGMDWDWAALGVDLVLNGHQHVYERFSIDGGSGAVPHITIGISGLTPQAGFGTVDPDSVVRKNSVVDADFAHGAYMEMYSNANYLYVTLTAVTDATVEVKHKDEILITQSATADTADSIDDVVIPCTGLNLIESKLWEVQGGQAYDISNLIAANIVTQEYFSRLHEAGSSKRMHFYSDTDPQGQSYVNFATPIFDSATVWTLAFRMDKFIKAGASDFLHGGLTNKNIRIDSFWQFKDSANGANNWDGTGNTTSFALADYQNRYRSVVMYADGTDIHLVVDGVDYGYITPATTQFYLKKFVSGYSTAHGAKGIYWDFRCWDSNIGLAEALLYHNNEMTSTPDHKYSMNKEDATDEVGSHDGTIVGTLDPVVYPAYTNSIDPKTGRQVDFTTDGSKLVPGTQVILPEDPVLKDAADNIVGNDWFDVGGNAQAVEVDEIVNETKLQYVGEDSRNDFMMVLDGIALSDAEDEAIKEQTESS